MVKSGIKKRDEHTFLQRYKVKQEEIIIHKAQRQFIFTKNNKYLDFSLSSGAMMLGHSNFIFKKYLKKQIDLGSNYSSNNYNKIQYEINLKKSFQEMSNFIFSNSGSEANIRALRLARAVSKKNNFAMVNGSWHGSVDEFMFDFKQKKKLNINEVDELSLGMGVEKKKIIMLPYNNIKLTKKILDKNYKSISVIVIEPIQCGIPTYESKKYLSFLEKYCVSKNILLWFDEIITGMRVKNLSIFKKYKMKPDIVTFAKCFGGGMPIGITCFNKKIEKKIKTLKKSIFFGGTFSGNPLSTKIGLETFKYIKKNQKKINLHINNLAELLEKNVNNYCKKNKISFRLQRYESLLRPIFTSERLTNKFYRNRYDKNFQKTIKFKNFLIDKKIFISSNCCFFISYCHNIKNINYLENVIKSYFKK